MVALVPYQAARYVNVLGGNFREKDPKGFVCFVTHQTILPSFEFAFGHEFSNACVFGACSKHLEVARAFRLKGPIGMNVCIGGQDIFLGETGSEV